MVTEIINLFYHISNLTDFFEQKRYRQTSKKRSVIQMFITFHSKTVQ